MLILVADDDQAVRDALEFSLRLEGFEVAGCSSGKGLLSHPALRKCDCILLDYKMPGLNGLDILTRLSAEGIAVPVIFMIGPLTEDLGRRAIKVGARVALEKPLLDSRVVEAIRDIGVGR